MNPKEIERFFKGIAKDFNQDATVYLTGAAAGAIAGLGLNLAPARAAAAKLKIRDAREVPSVCPYCAVGCGQIVSVKDITIGGLRRREIVNIEGNPDSPISGGTRR